MCKHLLHYSCLTPYFIKDNISSQLFTLLKRFTKLEDSNASLSDIIHSVHTIIIHFHVIPKNIVIDQYKFEIG